MQAIDKGGVGKSFFMIRLAEWLTSRNVPFSAFDPDRSNSTFSRFIQSAESLDISESFHMDAILEAFDRNNLVLVDGVGAQQKILLEWLEESELLSLREELNLGITLILIIGEDKDTIYQAGEAMRKVGPNANWLLVKNRKLARTNILYDKSKAHQELVRCGGEEMELEKLGDYLALFLQEHVWTMHDAIRSGEINLLDTQRLVQYQRNLFGSFEDHSPMLLP